MNQALDLTQTQTVPLRADPKQIGAGRDLPDRLLTAAEVASYVGCHTETIRRAYLRGLLKSQRFGVRSRRFHATDVRDWIERGAPTRPA